MTSKKQKAQRISKGKLKNITPASWERTNCDERENRISRMTRIQENFCKKVVEKFIFLYT